MNRFKVLIGACIGLLGMAGVAQALPVINYSYVLENDGFNVLNSMTTPYVGYTGVIVENFESTTIGSKPTGWSGDGMVVQGDSSGKYSAPAGAELNLATPVTNDYVKDRTKYFTVPIDIAESNDYVDLVFTNTYDYFGLWWGSIDDYNSLEFFNSSSVNPNLAVASYTGLTLPTSGSGNQILRGTNLYVNFIDLPDFNRVRFGSQSYAFEFDNVAVGNVPVPEPSTLLLLGAGLLGLAGVRRRKVKK